MGAAAVVDITARLEHTCALLNTGLVYCWGDNTNGQLGIGSTEDMYSPTLVNLPVGIYYNFLDFQ